MVIEYLVVIILLSGFFHAVGTAQSTTYESFEVTSDSEGRPCIYHQLLTGETLYRLTRNYGVDLDLIMQTNNLTDYNDLETGAVIKVPLSGKEFFTKSTKLDATKNYVAAYYEVQPQDNQFRIARRLFDIPLKDLRLNNNLKKSELAIGQLLFIGYLETTPKPVLAVRHQAPEDTEEFVIREKEVDEVPAIIEPLESRIEFSIEEEIIIDKRSRQESNSYEFVTQTGVAYWNKEMANQGGGLFVLCNEATTGTYLEITNPMFGKKITAKVIGPIPAETYKPDIIVVVSPTIARQLGALDSRFYVKMRYLQAIEEGESR
jgi:hypothetical protein